MWDLAGIYASLARVLNHQYDYSGRYNPLDYHPPRYLAGAWTDDEDLPGSGNHGEAGDLREAVNSAGAAALEKPRLSSRGLLDAAGIWFAFRAMEEVVRRSEEHTSELQSLMRISYVVFCLKKKKT